MSEYLLLCSTEEKKSYWFLTALITNTAAMSDHREWTPVTPVTPGVKDICLKEKTRIEEMIGKHFDVYTPISFTSYSLVGATNYVVKVQVGVDVCFHADISAVLCSAELTLTVDGVQYPKPLIDPLVPF